MKRDVVHYNADLFFIVETGAATEKPDFYQINGYSTTILKRARQIASGILIGSKNTLPVKPQILHEMEANDKLEAVLVNIWKNRQHFNIIALYNPPSNIPDYEIIQRSIKFNTILIGDFNSPSQRWGYPRVTEAGKCLEEMIDNNLLEVVETPATFLSFAGHLSRPDLAITHSHIFDKTSVTLLDNAVGIEHSSLRQRHSKCHTKIQKLLDGT